MIGLIFTHNSNATSQTEAQVGFPNCRKTSKRMADQLLVRVSPQHQVSVV